MRLDQLRLLSISMSLVWFLRANLPLSSAYPVLFFRSETLSTHLDLMTQAPFFLLSAELVFEQLSEQDMAQLGFLAFDFDSFRSPWRLR